MMADRGFRAADLREPALWAYVILLVGTGIAAVSQQIVFRDVSASGWVLAWLLVLLYVAPVFLVVFSLDLFEREPWPVLMAAVAWGAVPATTLASIANAGWGLALARASGPEVAASWSAVLAGPWVEETLKLCGLVLILMAARRAVTDLLDGFLYGVMIGLGFTIVEDVFYFMGVFGGEPGDVLRGFSLRAVSSGLYGHLLYSGLAGVGLAYFITRRDRRPLGYRLLVASVFFLAAVAAHVLWNTPWLDLFPRRPWNGADLLVLPVAAAVKIGPFLIMLAVFVVLARRRSARWLAGMREEVEAGVVSVGALRSLGSPRSRRRAVRELRTRAGPGAARLGRRLQREHLRLAMMRGRGQAGDEELRRQRSECASLRDALRAIPGAASADEG